MQGGYRENAGRKKGYAAIESEKAREAIVRRVNESLEPILDSLINEAKNGNIGASKELFDRAFGRSTQQIDLMADVQSKVIRIDE